MKTAFLHIFTLLAVITGGTAIGAVSPAEKASISVTATDPVPVIGDSLSLIVTLSLPAGATAGTPYLPVESPDFDILPHWEHTDSTGMGATRNQYGLLAYVFQPDTLVVGPFLVDYTTAAGNSETVMSGTVTLLVNGVLEADNTAPIPDRAPVAIPGGFPWWIVAAGLAAAGLVLLLIARRKRPAPTVIAEAPVDDIDVFRRIAAMHLHESGEIRQLYILVSKAIREFIHRRVGYDARSRTTWEIRRNLTGNRLHRNTLPALMDLLDEADMVKFARYAPPAADTASATDRAAETARRILDEIEQERKRIETARTAAASRKASHGDPVTADPEGGEH